MYSYVLSVIAYCIRIALYSKCITSLSLSQLFAILSFGLAPISILYHNVRQITTRQYYNCVTGQDGPGLAPVCPCSTIWCSKIFGFILLAPFPWPLLPPGGGFASAGERLFGWGFAPPEPCGQTPSRSRTLRSDCSVLPMSAFIMLRSARLPFAPTMWWL